jgi:hypothetical protein
VTVADIARAVGGEFVVEADAGRAVAGCYVSDMLSDVLASSNEGDLWITQHTHANVAVVASVKELAAVLLTGRKPIDEDMVAKARTEGVNVIRTGLTAFQAAGEVYALLKRT